VGHSTRAARRALVRSSDADADTERGARACARVLVHRVHRTSALKVNVSVSSTLRPLGSLLRILNLAHAKLCNARCRSGPGISVAAAISVYVSVSLGLKSNNTHVW
jgi:hypothetical protein